MKWLIILGCLQGIGGLMGLVLLSKALCYRRHIRNLQQDLQNTQQQLRASEGWRQQCDAIIVTDVNGLKIACHSQDVVITNNLLYTKQWEPHFQRTLKNFIREFCYLDRFV